MKKSLIALAVAGAFAAPAFAATSNVDVYGILNIAIESNDTDATNGGDELAVINNTSRIGFKGSEDLGGGLKAIWQIEQGLGTDAYTVGTVKKKSYSTTVLVPTSEGTITTTFSITDQDSPGWANRNTFVGLSGGFGTVLMGRHDTPYKISTGSLDPFADTIADYNQSRVDAVDVIDATHDARAAAAVAYISPTFSGFSFAGAVVLENNTSNGGLQKAGEDIDAYSLMATYANGPIFATVAYQDVEALDSQAWKIGGSYAFGDLKLGGLYENVENYGGNAGLDRSSWMLAATYAMGPISLKAAYGMVDRDTSATTSRDEDKWAIGADYNMSKRTTAYAVYTAADNEAGADASGFNLGVKHSF